MNKVLILAATMIFAFSGAFAQDSVDDAATATTTETAETCDFNPKATDNETCALGVRMRLREFMQDVAADDEGTAAELYVKHVAALYKFRGEYDQWRAGLRDEGLLDKGSDMADVVKLADKELSNAIKILNKMEKEADASVSTSYKKRKK